MKTECLDITVIPLHFVDYVEAALEMRLFEAMLLLVDMRRVHKRVAECHLIAI